MLLFVLGHLQAATLTQYWPLDDGGTSAFATNAVSGGNQGSLALMDTNSAWVSSGLAEALSRSKAALAFDGVDDYVNLGNVKLKDKGTISFWVNPVTDDSDLRLFSQLSFVSPYAGVIRLDTYGTGDVQINAGGDWMSLAPMSALPAGSWTHVALVYDYGTVKLWANGVEQGPGATSGLDFDAAEFGLGARFDLPGAIGGPFGKAFSGQIDDVSMWNGPLSSNSIVKLAAGVSPTAIEDSLGAASSQLTLAVETPAGAQLVQYYPIEETAGFSLTNALASGNTGCLSNYVASVAPWVSSELQPLLTNNSAALLLDGKASYADLGFLDLTNGATFSFWLKPAGGLVDQRLLGQLTGPIASGGAVGFAGTSGLQVWDGVRWLTLADDGAILENEWSHLALVYTADSVTAYVNGVEQLTAAARVSFGTNGCGLGAKFLTTYGNSFNGLLDDVAIWGEALSSTEIQALVSGVSPKVLGSTAPLVGYFPLNGSGTNLTVANVAPGGSDGRLVNVSATVQSWVNEGLPPMLSYSRGALFLDGLDDFVNLGNIGLSGAATIAFWMHPSTVAGDRRLFSPLTGEISQAGAAGFSANGSVWAWTGGASPLVAPAGTITNNQWYHMAFVYGSGGCTLYVNGVEKQSASLGFNFDATEFGLAGRFLGQYGGCFSGLIDDVSVWNGPISPKTIEALAGGAKPTTLKDEPMNLVLSWPIEPVGFRLQSSPSLSAPAEAWTATPLAWQKVVETNNVATVPVTSGARYFRLKRD